MITLENARHQQQVSWCPGSEVNFHFELAEFMFDRRNPVGRNFNSIILLFGTLMIYLIKFSQPAKINWTFDKKGKHSNLKVKPKKISGF